MATSVLRELLDAALSSALDPEPVRFRRTDERGVRPIRNVCRTSSDAPHPLRRPLTRNAFLCGCLDLTQSEPIEHLIVGLGQRHGNTTLVDTLAHVTGSAASVSMPPWLSSAIAHRLAEAHRSEAVIVHNHPRHILNVLLDNVPLASGTDRETLTHTYLNPALWLKAASGGGRVRFYIAENGYVREFRTPRLLPLLQQLARAETS